MTLQTVSADTWRKKAKRVAGSRGPRFLRKCLQIERIYADDTAYYEDTDSYDEFTMSALYGSCKVAISGKLRKWAKRNPGIDPADFESAMSEAVWDVVKRYDPANTEFYLYETVLIALDRSCIDTVRSNTGYRRKSAVTSIVPLESVLAVASDTDMAEMICDRLFIEQMIDDNSLSDDDKRLLRLLYSDVSLSHNDIAVICGMNNGMAVKRQLKQIATKLTVYKEYI